MNIKILFLFALSNFGMIGLTSGSAAATLGLLMPLIPIAVLTGNSALWGSGLTGVALLKLKAAAALASGFLLKRGSRGGFSFGIGGHGGGGGNGWDRRKRSVETEADARGETVNLDLKEYDPSMDEILEFDQSGCGLRMICELSATPEEYLLDDEKIILELFGNDEKAPKSNKVSRGKMSYTYASLLGKNGKDITVCSRVFGMCPYSGHDVMQTLRQANL